MTLLSDFVNDFDKNWLFYLAQPSKLLTDLEQLSVSHKLNLLKQALSQAELDDRKLAVSENSVPDNSISDRSLIHGELDINPSHLYKKSRILDYFSLQIASSLKFNLNLFRVAAEIPVKLLARLYRVLVTNTARCSSSFCHIFEQAGNKEYIYLINPYDNYAWLELDSMLTYSIMSYHIWCLQVSLTVSMLQQPFRNLTPVVSGLTEIPDVTFFTDNRVEVGVVLARINESISQLTEIYNNLQVIEISRPLPTAFFVSLNKNDNNGSKKTQNMVKSEVLPKLYLSASLNFVIGRCAFQRKDFSKAVELFESVLFDMESEKLTYLYEVGATQKLVTLYLTSCRSYTSTLKISPTLKPESKGYEFIEWFCVQLDQQIERISDKQPINLFWIERWSVEMKKEFEFLEDSLYQVLIDDIIKFKGLDEDSLVLPIGRGLRLKLQMFCYKLANLLLEDLNLSKNVKNAKSVSNNVNVTHFDAVQRLYTKVYVCNAVEQLVSGLLEMPNQLVTELFSNLTNKQASILNPNVAYTYIFDCLHLYLDKLGTQPRLSTRNDEANRNRAKHVHIIQQFLVYLIQEGCILIAPVCQSTGREEIENGEQMLENYHKLLDTLKCHRLLSLMPKSCQSYIESLSNPSASNIISNPNNLPNLVSHLTSSFEDRLSDDVDKHLGRLLTKFGAKIETPFGTTDDVDMRTLPLEHYNRLCVSTSTADQHTNPTVSSSIGGFFKDILLDVAQPDLVQRLLVSLDSNMIGHCVDSLLKLGMNSEAILRLNSSWLPSLYYLASLDGIGPHGSASKNNLFDPIECALQTLFSLKCTVAIIVKLAKAFGIVRYDMGNLIHCRQLLVGILKSVNPVGQRLPNSNLWIRTAARHELMLADMLEFMNSNSAVFDWGSNTSSSNNQSSLNDLVRRSKFCLFHASGLASKANALGQKMDWIVLSEELINAAVCFLLFNREYGFFLSTFSTSKSQPFLSSGSLSYRHLYSGSIEFVRLLLRLHECLLSASHRNSPPDSDKHLRRNHSAPSLDSNTSDVPKAICEDLVKFMVHGCLVYDLIVGFQNYSNKDGQYRGLHSQRVRMNLTSLHSIAHILSSNSNLPVGHSKCPKRLQRDSTVLSPHLFNYIIIAMAHIIHILMPKFELEMYKSTLDQLVRMNDTNYQNASMTIDDGQHEVDQYDLDWNLNSQLNANIDWNLISWGVLNLSDNALWTTNLAADYEWKLDLLLQVLHRLVETGLNSHPTRIDWLLIRAEMEYIELNYRLALSTYLEIGILLTDSFTNTAYLDIFCSKEIVFRMVTCCQQLGLMYEAIVLCQFGPNESLVEHALKMISNLEESVLILASYNLGSNWQLPNASNDFPKFELSRSATGGLLCLPSLDCADDLLNYLWNIRIIEALIYAAQKRASLTQLNRLKNLLNTPELNVNNADEVLMESRSSQIIGALRYISDLYLTEKM